MFDPITALAPASDCQTYAIGSVEAVRGTAVTYVADVAVDT